MTVLRSALFNLYFFLASFVLVVIGTVLRFIAPQRLLDLGRVWARLVLVGARAICGIRVQVTGLWTVSSSTWVNPSDCTCSTMRRSVN